MNTSETPETLTLHTKLFGTLEIDEDQFFDEFVAKLSLCLNGHETVFHLEFMMNLLDVIEFDKQTIIETMLDSIPHLYDLAITKINKKHPLNRSIRNFVRSQMKIQENAIQPKEILNDMELFAVRSGFDYFGDLVFTLDLRYRNGDGSYLSAEFGESLNHCTIYPK